MKIQFNKDKKTIFLSVISGLVCLLLVTSMLIQFKTVDKSKEEDLERLRSDELKTQISAYKSKYEETMGQYNENKNKIDEYQSTIDENKESSNLLDKELEQTNTLLGLTDVEGEGVIITLKDTDDAIYTSEDLRTLVNELKYAGAEAISINDNRVINLTEIVTINNSFIVMNGDERLTSPYVIKAIGDKTYLSSTLNLKNSGYVDIMKSNNLYITVEQSNNITIKKYNKTITTEIMKEVK